MSQYKYRGRSGRGETITGRLDAESVDAAAARLLNLDINSDLRASPRELLTSMGADPSVERLRQATLHNYSVTPGALRPRMRTLIEAIADAKAEIFTGVERGGAAVLNRDNAQFSRLTQRAKECGIARNRR